MSRRARSQERTRATSTCSCTIRSSTCSSTWRRPRAGRSTRRSSIRARRASGSCRARISTRSCSRVGQIANGYKLSAAYPGRHELHRRDDARPLRRDAIRARTCGRAGLQVSYKHPPKTVDVSNEVVTYVKGGAQQALAEVSKVAQTCSTKTVIQKRGAITTTFRTTAMHDPKLPADHGRREARDQGRRTARSTSPRPASRSTR